MESPRDLKDSKTPETKKKKRPKRLVKSISKRLEQLANFSKKSEPAVTKPFTNRENKLPSTF